MSQILRVTLRQQHRTTVARQRLLNHALSTPTLTLTRDNWSSTCWNFISAAQQWYNTFTAQLHGKSAYPHTHRHTHAHAHTHTHTLTQCLHTQMLGCPVSHSHKNQTSSAELYTRYTGWCTCVQMVQQCVRTTLYSRHADATVTRHCVTSVTAQHCVITTRHSADSIAINNNLTHNKCSA